MNMETYLYEEIENEFNALAKKEVGSPEHAKAVDSLTKLMDRAIEMEKVTTSAAQNEQQMIEDRKSRLVKNLIDIGGVVLPLAVTVWGAKVSFKFEETGTITSAAGRQFIQKLFKFK